MSRHIRPEKWADAAAGRLPKDAVRAMNAHAETCAKCKTTRARIDRASQSFTALRTEPPPELSWDTVRARIHWSVSSEKRARDRERDRAPVKKPHTKLALGAAGVLAAATIALAIWTGPVGRMIAPSPSTQAPAVSTKSHEPIAVTLVSPSPTPVVGIVSRVAGQIMIDGVRRTDVFDLTLAAGTVIATADGRIDVQFGEGSAFALGPRSTLELRRFDAERIELAVDGTVDVTVAPRAAGQRFLVVAGDETVEVRGTQFRVQHDTTGTQVACRHGRVVVSDAKGTAEVATARKLAVTAAAPIDPAHVAALSVDELDQLAEATPATMPVWQDPATLVQTSSALEIATVGNRAVRVDGVELGEAPLRVRVMPGRHTVETADAAGRFRHAGWVDVAADKPARLVVQPELGVDTPRASAAGERRRQLHAGIDHLKLAQCTRAIGKAGLTAYVHIEISIDETGAVGFLNILDTDLASGTASCVRDVLADVRFKPGPAATFREKFDL